MKTRQSLVSNSSSSSFIVRGIEFNSKELCEKLNVSDTNSLYEMLHEQHISLELISMNNYFDHLHNEDLTPDQIILGQYSSISDSFDDGCVIKVPTNDIVDEGICNELGKLFHSSFHPSSLSTFIQYTSNSNC